jgi:2-polyprenyl-3-methyl-5-hydroxy-6-metoxy-1,4-benzoquinol methylase
MAGSNPENREWVRQRVLEIQPRTIVDVGAGIGTYSDLLRHYLPTAEFTAIEIYQKNIDQFNLDAIYDKVICADVRFMNAINADLIIFGDVLEHMTKAEAIAVWEMARKGCSWAILSIPIIHYPQGEVDGNIHETHVVDDWNNLSVFACFDGIVEAKIGKETGAYLARGKGLNL